MKGREDDRRLFERGVKLNVMALMSSSGFDDVGLANAMDLSDYGLQLADLTELKKLFEHATTFGALIQVPAALTVKLPVLKRLTNATSQDLLVTEALESLGHLLQQAQLLALQYDAVVANPPYMGIKAYCPILKRFVSDAYKAGKADLYGAFTLRNIELAKMNGHVGMITIPNWMFLSSLLKLRASILHSAPISSLIHNGRGVWGSDFGSCSYVLRRCCPCDFEATFLRLFDKQGSVSSVDELERCFHSNQRFTTVNSEFNKIPGSPIAYWVSGRVRDVFACRPSLGSSGFVSQGLITTDNERFLRFWFEVGYDEIGIGLSRDQARQSRRRWFPVHKGGAYRKWYGNLEYVVDWQNDGETLHRVVIQKYPYLKGNSDFVLKRSSPYFEPAATWTDISSAYFGARYLPPGVLYERGGSAAIWRTPETTTALLASSTTSHFLNLMNPTFHFQVGDIAALPVPDLTAIREDVLKTRRLVQIGQQDWNDYERSWEFKSFPLFESTYRPTPTLESSYTAWITQNKAIITEMKLLEEANNRLFIDAYGLQDELTQNVPSEQITLTVNPAYRYGGNLGEAEQWERFRRDTMAELLSYATGCMMGRYSLDQPGLVLADSRDSQAGQLTAYEAKVGKPLGEVQFKPDPDGIIPVLDGEWFEDDIVARTREFLAVTFPESSVGENLRFIEESLGNLWTNGSCAAAATRKECLWS